jgi:lysophospholipid acyltransferase (LPLAT)-like uncharacterized protein
VRTLKDLARKEWARRIACWAMAQYIRVVRRTGRWTVRGDRLPRRLWAEGRPFILAFWHGRLLMMPYCWDRRVPIKMLISQHIDGRLIARTVGHFGIDTVAGSSSKGGTAALRGILKALKAGECVGFTPDGPRGPRMRASPGVVNAARLAGVPILPCSYGVTNRRVLRSWDRFLLALPFGRGILLWGDPIEVPRDADEAALEAARRAVEDSLNALTREADLLCGTEPVEPAPLPVPGSAEAIAPAPGRAVAGKR